MGQMGQSAAEQEALRRALGELMRRMGEAGMEIPRALGQAEMAMRDARGSLEQGQPGEAAGSQSQAIDAMQQAGQAMMQQMQEQMAREQGDGPGGQPQPNGRLRLIGADYLVLASAWDALHPGEPPQIMGQLLHLFEAPNRFGLPSFYTLHVWAWKENPTGTFVNWHANVSCDSFSGQ